MGPRHGWSLSRRAAVSGRLSRMDGKNAVLRKNNVVYLRIGGGLGVGGGGATADGCVCLLDGRL